MVELRALEVEDLPLVRHLARAFHAEDGREISRRGLQSFSLLARGTPHGRAYLICRPHSGQAGSEPVGYLVVSLGFSVEYGGVDCFLDDLYIMPEHRGRGLGTRALKKLRSLLRRHGVKAMHLQLMPKNQRALRFYLRLGFEPSTRLMMSAAWK